MASSMLSHSSRGNRQMKSKLNLMTAMVGLAMLATPLTAAAKDHGRYNYSHAARVASATPYVAPVTRHEFRQEAKGTWMNGISPNAGRGWRHDRGWADANAYRN